MTIESYYAQGYARLMPPAPYDKEIPTAGIPVLIKVKYWATEDEGMDYADEHFPILASHDVSEMAYNLLLKCGWYVNQIDVDKLVEEDVRRVIADKGILKLESVTR